MKKPIIKIPKTAHRNLYYKKEKSMDSVKQKISTVVVSISRFFEIALSAIMILTILAMIFSVIGNLYNIPISKMTSEQFTGLLENILTMIIGVEFIKMLAKHTEENQLEVLTFAIIRQMVVKCENMGETLLGMIALGLVFLMRKYFLFGNTEKTK